MAVKRRTLAAAAAACVMALAMTFTSAAAEVKTGTENSGSETEAQEVMEYEGGYDAAKLCSLKVSLLYGGERIDSGKVSICRVAEIDYTDSSITAVDNTHLKDFSITWSNIQNSGEDEEAADGRKMLKELQDKVLSEEKSLSKSGLVKEASAKDSAIFKGLPQGVYLVYQGNGDNADGYKYFDPYLVALPSGDLFFNEYIEGKDGEKSEAFIYNMISNVKLEQKNENESKVSIDPPIVKYVKGKNAPQTDAFTFVLKVGDGAPGITEMGTNVKETTPDKVYELTTSVKNNPQEFGRIDFYKAGEYSYTVEEKKGTNSKYTYDKKIYTITVTVDENRNGLTKTVKYSANNKVFEKNRCEFTNYYGSGGGGGGGGGGGSTPSKPYTGGDVIEASGEVAAPQTGDTSPMRIFGSIAALAALGLAAWFMVVRHRRDEH